MRKLLNTMPVRGYASRIGIIVLILLAAFVATTLLVRSVQAAPSGPSAQAWLGGNPQKVNSIILQDPTITPTVTITPTITPTPTETATITPTVTITPTEPTETPTPPPTITITPTVTITPTETITPTPTITPTTTITPTETGQPRVAICHETGSHNHPFIYIEVAEPAVPAHLRHGDYLAYAPGDCDSPTTTPEPTEEPGQGQGGGQSHDDDGATQAPADQDDHGRKKDDGSKDKGKGQSATSTTGSLAFVSAGIVGLAVPLAVFRKKPGRFPTH